MILFLLLLLPLLIGLGGHLLFRARVTAKELLVQEGALLLVICIGYGIALSDRASDVEHWNGRIANKWRATTGCCHSYPCRCVTTCTGGKNSTCSTHCQTCYLHSWDQAFYARTTNDETVFSDTCNSPGSAPPARWVEIVPGEPTSVEHSFTNYVKANAETIMRRTGALERWAGTIPEYPKVYDYYRADHFIVVGLPDLPRRAALNEQLAQVNAEQGRRREVNAIVIVAKAGDPSYAEAIREAWLGGKKNDLIVVVGAASFPQLDWVSVVSWSEREDMKLAIRDRIMGYGTFNGSAIVEVVRQEIAKGFVRKRWEDFDYLKATVEPSNAAKWVLGIIGVLLSIGMTVLFHQVDAFGEERLNEFFQDHKPRGRWRDGPVGFRLRR